MTLAERIKQLRRELGFSQEAVGAQGFVSAPGWIKIENGQRQASEKLIGSLVAWLIRDKHIRSSAAGAFSRELLTLKHLGSRSAFVRCLASDHAKANGLAHLLLPSMLPRAKRGRPPVQLHRPPPLTRRQRKAVAA